MFNSTGIDGFDGNERAILGAAFSETWNDVDIRINMGQLHSLCRTDVDDNVVQPAMGENRRPRRT